MDEVLAAAQAQLDADANRWFAEESADTWCLYRGVHQIIKAPKHGTAYAEYWPSPAESAQIVAALNAQETTRAALAAVTAERDRYRAEAAALYDEARYARDVLYQQGFRYAGEIAPYPDNPYRTALQEAP